MPANHIKQPSSGALPTDGSNPLQLSKHLDTAIFKRLCLLFYCKKKKCSEVFYWLLSLSGKLTVSAAGQTVVPEAAA